MENYLDCILIWTESLFLRCTPTKVVHHIKKKTELRSTLPQRLCCMLEKILIAVRYYLPFTTLVIYSIFI